MGRLCVSFVIIYLALLLSPSIISILSSFYSLLVVKEQGQKRGVCVYMCCRGHSSFILLLFLLHRPLRECICCESIALFFFCFHFHSLLRLHFFFFLRFNNEKIISNERRIVLQRHTFVSFIFFLFKKFLLLTNFRDFFQILASHFVSENLSQKKQKQTLTYGDRRDSRTTATRHRSK